MNDHGWPQVTTSDHIKNVSDVIMMLLELWSLYPMVISHLVHSNQKLVHSTITVTLSFTKVTPLHVRN